jgi:hypothetical protein
MNQDILLELKSFSSKVKIVEQKLGVAMEESENDNDSPRSRKIEVIGPVLCESSYVEAEEETKAFVSKRKSFECLCSLLKRFYYSCTCDCLHFCLTNFLTYMKVTLIVCDCCW